MVATITGIEPQPNKAIVGKNAFAHESGIHQDGVLKYKQTYEIISASDIGLEKNNSIVLGKHSGRHAFKDKAEELGFNLSKESIDDAFAKFKALADKKKDIYDDDIRMLLSEESTHIPKIYDLIKLQINDCSEGLASAAATIKFDGQNITDAAIGDGTIDAVFKVIDRISGYNGFLVDYKVDAVSEGKDALARVVVKVIFDDTKPAIIGHGLDIDTMKASAMAYIGALNSFLSMRDRLTKNNCYMSV
jgi:2-isopropylmalate synthase